MLFARKLKKLSDEELVRKYQSEGDPAILGELFERYNHLVFLSCMKYLKNELESEDVTMRVFEKLMVELKKHDIQRFKSWLYTVVKNMCFSYLSKKQREQQKSDAYHHQNGNHYQEESNGLIPDARQIKELKLSKMEEAMMHLKPVQRQCLELFYLQEKSYKDVAQETGYTMKQVKSYIQNGKRNLLIRMNE